MEHLTAEILIAMHYARKLEAYKMLHRSTYSNKKYKAITKILNGLDEETKSALTSVAATVDSFLNENEL